MTDKKTGGLTDVPGIRVGHATDPVGLTGCTVVLCEEGAVGGVDQRGGAPGTRETDLLRPMHLVEKVHAVLLTGGSAFGLAAADGVVRYLEERGVGFDTGVAKVPIVPAAVIFDLNLGDPAARPDAAMGYAACQAATDGPVPEGNVGAGTGASAGKVLGITRAMKTGVGSAAVHLGDGLVVAALMVVNPFGNVVDPQTGQILAGVRPPDMECPADPLILLRFFYEQGLLRPFPATNTVIGVVATNARLSKEAANKVAQMAQDGVARAVRPAHTMFDGDTLFALATGEKPADISLVGAFAAEVVAQAVARAATTAENAGGLPAWRDLSERS
ncbi:MAG: P1 family peptidase [Anaerolineae bacterium]|nr:P1 family peptidase [Anaerolineae bacterium]MDW8068115.1 P1 family peptidase [Anaerolineae bacterium]